LSNNQGENVCTNKNDIAAFSGLFEPSHMSFEVDRSSDVWGEPSLAEMVEKALKILQRGPQGYALLVEGQ
jgi:alkaline phosphatase